MNSDRLVIQDIYKAFGGATVLEGVTLSAAAGGLSGLIGPNGAGKSTLFSIVSGFQKADAGEIFFEGHDVTRLDVVDRVRLGMGRTFQVPREFGSLSVRENLMAAAPDQSGESLLSVFLRPGAIRAQEAAIAEEADGWLDFLNLSAVADLRAASLSGGQRKLLELGRVLMLRPRMILLDEPFAGVNPVLIGEIAQKIRTLSARGIGFLIVEHNLASLSALVDHLFVIDRGTLLAEGHPAAVLADPRVREAYMGGVV
ncbi:ABC transporter ATP-binding protein [Rhodospirillum rubrum]|uniref:ABC transporter component n=1 Tax=Rhodospirillum rubrum (strain ATCC 11170 / ATH 1.1.1 / DSM 467 / LMG 4362 / NCIMB 8255 / S1) TaxID=269796 RepID=Q2RNT7_RHORT|nr:ABC transporter ATP-binding protein [Rhodospirillum rubrum]ABC24208.1 ABC transporter component [Rhodospirillum rubrum ATCC 11170]AEO49959.1 ABC transporter protein [Rhodospirillum rubrum F11]MBK5955926.1 ABC transporter ATP-binding protein [Rhodospirillum rubrum]QXG80143.1 ABC transporter ATP-binding protein [Rhodospirillum rubrum]HCF18770.1 ABC transporter ATP-binding protein [Rhodospirillum rubrum]